MPSSGNPDKVHLCGCEPLFDTGLAAQFRCETIPFVEPTMDQQIVLMYRTDKNGNAAQYAGHTIPKKYPDAFTLEFKAK